MWRIRIAEDYWLLVVFDWKTSKGMLFWPTPMFARTVQLSFLLLLTLPLTVNAAKLPKSFNGFVTEVSSGQFYIGSREVNWSSHATRIYQVVQGAEMDASSTAAIRVGAYLHLEGKSDKKSGKFVASSIGLLQPELKEIKVQAAGLIEEEPKLVSSGSGVTGVIWADGYPLRVTGSTKLLSADGKPFPARQIQPNVWATFDAIRKPDGTVEALSIAFEPNTVTANEVKFRDKSEPKITLPDYAKGIPGEIKFKGSWALKILPNKSVQNYVATVGEKLIPEYQKNLPDGDLGAIKFRFYVVGHHTRWKESLHDAVAMPGGSIIIPDNVLATLNNEAQLAALLSNCIAVTLEKQLYAHRTQSEVKKYAGTAADMAVLGVPAGIALSIWSGKALEPDRNKQTVRIGMRYMLHAGYDIREAPFAWDAAANHDAQNPRSGDYILSSFEQSVLGDLYFYYTSIDYSRLKANRSAYRQMLATLQKDDPKLPKAKNHD